MMIRVLAAFVAGVLLAGCGGGEDAQPARYLQFYASNGLIGQVPTDNCSALRARFADMETSGTSFHCTPDSTSTAVPYSLGVRLDGGDQIVWFAPTIERCNVLSAQMDARGDIIGACARR